MWFRSLFYFHPEVALMVNIPVAFKIHIVVAMVLFIIWPFTRLVHALTVPLHYVFRPYTVYRTRGGPACGHVEAGIRWVLSRVSVPPANTHIQWLQKRKYEHPCCTELRPKEWSAFNVLLATFVSTIGFWAWTIVGPLAKMYAKQMHLDAGMTSLLVAMPIFIGAYWPYSVGGLTDRYGGRIMFTIVLAVSAPLVLLVGVAGQMNSLPMLLIVSFFLGIAGTVFAVGIPSARHGMTHRRRASQPACSVQAWWVPRFSAFATPAWCRVSVTSTSHSDCCDLCSNRRDFFRVPEGFPGNHWP